MERYIDANAYIKYCDDNWIPLNVDAVNAQPRADVVKVVRCKDCKWRRKWKDEKNSYYCAKDNIAILGNLKPNFYCGYGKRKETKEMSRQTLYKCDICGFQSANEYLYTGVPVPTPKYPLCDDILRIEVIESSALGKRRMDICYSCREKLVETVLEMRKAAKRRAENDAD